MSDLPSKEDLQRMVKNDMKNSAELRKELETERMRLAACGVASMSNTTESAKAQRITRDNPYWSASYGDICNMVDREIKLRSLNAEMLRALECIQYYTRRMSAPTVKESKEMTEMVDRAIAKAKGD